MSRDPVTLQTGMAVTKAVQLMQEKDIRHLPILDGDRLVGILTDRDLKEFSPGKASTLDIHEAHYLLSRATVEQAMSREPHWVVPEDPIERAARLLHDHKVGCLPVLEDGEVLVGILTQQDVFEALVAVTGCRSETTRLQMTIPDAPGSIKTVTDQVRAHKLKITSILTTYVDVAEGCRELILRVEGDAQELVGKLRDFYPDLVVHRGC